MKIIRNDHKPLIIILVKRTISFFLGICILLLFLYGVGTRQSFMDSTQIKLLQGIITTGFFLGVASVYAIFLNIWFTFYKKILYVKSMGYYIIIGIFGFMIAGLGTFILTITGVFEI